MTSGTLRARSLAGVLFAALLAWSCAAAGQVSPSPRRVALTVEIAPELRESCPTPADFGTRLDAYLVGSPSPERIEASVHVLRRGEGLAAVIRLDRSGAIATRELRGMDCTVLVEASVLVVAIAADPATLSREAPGDRPPSDDASLPSDLEVSSMGETTDTAPSDASATAPGAAAPSAVAPSAAARSEASETNPHETAPEEAPREVAPTGSAPSESGPSESAPAEPTPQASGHVQRAPTHEEPQGGLGFHVRLGASLCFGALPEPSPGAQLEVGARVEAVELSVGLGWSSEVSASQSPGIGGTFALYTALVRAGLPLRIVGGLQVVPSVRASAGVMTGRGFGVARPLLAAQGWIDLGGGLEGRWRWRDLLGPSVHFGVFVSAEVFVPLARLSFHFSLADTVFRPLEVGGSVALGAAIFFG
jgi:hypothetical protein